MGLIHKWRLLQKRTKLIMQKKIGELIINSQFYSSEIKFPTYGVEVIYLKKVKLII